MSRRRAQAMGLCSASASSYSYSLLPAELLKFCFLPGGRTRPSAGSARAERKQLQCVGGSGSGGPSVGGAAAVAQAVPGCGRGRRVWRRRRGRCGIDEPTSSGGCVQSRRHISRSKPTPPVWIGSLGYDSLFSLSQSIFFSLSQVSKRGFKSILPLISLSHPTFPVSKRHHNTIY